jgi:hypothetical protein
MGNRLSTVTESTVHADEFQQALAHISNAATKRMPDIHPQRPAMLKRRTISSPLSAFTPIAKLEPVKPLDLPMPLQDALRHAGISFAQDSVDALQDTLVRAQHEREKKLQDRFLSSSALAHERLAERSHKADRDLRAIMEALYAHTPFQKVSLTDAKVEAQLKRMDRELAEKNDDLLDAESNELSLGDPRVRAFIKKYGA